MQREAEDAARAGELGERGPAAASAGAQRAAISAFGEIAEREQEIVQAVGVRDGAAAVEALERALQLGDGAGVEQLAQLGLAEELAELGGVDAERVGAALGEGRVAVVEEVADVGEHQRRREGRGDARCRR